MSAIVGDNSHTFSLDAWNFSLKSPSGSDESNSSLGSSSRPHPVSYRVNFSDTPVVQIVLTVLSTIINLLILLTICFKRKYRKRTNFLIANLSLASMVYNLTFLLRVCESKLQLDLNYEAGLCGIFAVLHRFPMPVISMTTMAISLERSQSATATAPLQLIPSRARTALKVFTIWSLSILLTLPAAVTNVFDSSAVHQYSSRKCRKTILHSYWVHISYAVIHVTVVFAIPTAVLVCELRRMRTRIKFLIWRQERVTCKTDERLRLVRNACIFTGLFIMFWLPIGIYLTIYDLPNEIIPYWWKLDYMISFRRLHVISSYFIVFIPVLLFVMSEGLRESFCSCLMMKQHSPQHQRRQTQPLPRSPAVSAEGEGEEDLDCLGCWNQICCCPRERRRSVVELSVLEVLK